MNYRELQRVLKGYRNAGLTTIKLNQKKVILQAEYDRITQRQGVNETELTFGVEIEILDTVEMSDIARALREAGIAAEVEGYNHATRRHWKIITDSSCGLEIVSPILQGQRGLDELRKVAETLTRIGCEVNSSCGVHVHIGAGSFSCEKLKAIVTRWMSNESNLDTIQPRSRRGTNNTYCQPTATTLDLNRFRRASTVDDIINSQHTRYSKLNLQSFRRHRTIEFRHHSGSTNGEKLTNWVKFLLDFVTTSTPETATDTGFEGMFANNNIAEFYRSRQRQLAR